MKRLSTILVCTTAVALTGCATTQASHTDIKAEATAHTTKEAPEARTSPAPAGNFTAEEIAWRPFNPEKPEGIHVYIIKGDPSKGAFSALVKMPPGAKAPLHIHSADYVGVSLTDGFVSGADEATAAMLPKFSSWVQPGGASHFNACQSEAPCVFMVSFKGAVDMKPVEAAVEGTFEKKETAGDAIPWKVVREGMENSPKMFVIHGNPKEGAFEAIFWFPPGMSTNIHTHSASFAAAVLQGEHHRGESAEAVKALGPGSVWHEVAGSPHMEKCAGPEACIFAVSFDGPLDTQNVELTTE